MDQRLFRERLVALTQDLKLLDEGPERQAITSSRAGIVIMRPGDAVNFDVLRFVVQRMAWLRQIDQQTRPFVYVASVNSGYHRLAALSSHAH